MKKLDGKSKLKTEEHNLVLSASVGKNEKTTKSNPFKNKTKNKEKQITLNRVDKMETKEYINKGAHVGKNKVSNKKNPFKNEKRNNDKKK